MTEETVRRAEKRAKAIEIMGDVCTICGSDKGLEFDHINRDRKDNAHLLSQLWGSSWKRILDELGKCQLLCKPCHTKKTLRERGVREVAIHGTQARYGGKHNCRCDLCRKAHNENVRKYDTREKANERMRIWRQRQKLKGVML